MLLIKTSELQQSVGFAITDAEEGTGRIKQLAGEIISAMLNRDEEPVTVEHQLKLRDAADEMKQRLDKLVELRSYCKFAEESNIELLHLTPEMFALVKHNLPAR